MQINLKWDNVSLIRRLEKGEKRLAYAAVNAINFALKEVQAAEIAEIRRDVTVRRPEFTLKQIAIISPFANVKQARAFGEVSIGRKPRTLLGMLATGGQKEHRGKSVAIPVTGEEARPTFATPQTFPPLVKLLKFKRPRGRRRRGVKVVLQGVEGRFLIPGVGIFRRRGTQVRAIILYRPEVRVRPKVPWLAVAQRVGAESLREGMEREAINAVGRAG